MKLYREKAGIISDDPIWVFMDEVWLYAHPTLFKLIFIVLTEWRNDRHLV